MLELVDPIGGPLDGVADRDDEADRTGDHEPGEPDGDGAVAIAGSLLPRPGRRRSNAAAAPPTAIAMIEVDALIAAACCDLVGEPGQPVAGLARRVVERRQRRQDPEGG